MTMCLGHTLYGQENTLSFQILHTVTGLPLESAEVVIQPCACGGITNFSGRFAIILPQEKYAITISYIGYRSEVRELELKSSQFLNIELLETEEQLSEVIVRAKRINDNVELPQMGAMQLGTQEIKKIPSGLGEVDVLRGMTLLAGANNAGEISNGVP